jgi:phosphoserine phosphatase
VVVVSASIDRWVKPFFEPSVIIIGTQIETRDGFLTGRFATPNCYGEEKVRRLRQLFPELAFGGISHSSLLAPRSSKNPRPLVIAYGDSRGDRELLQLADEAHYKPFR